MSIEEQIRDQDLEAGWQRWTNIRWPHGVAVSPQEVINERNAFGAGAAWMFELLVNLGERPHELADRIKAMRDQLHGFSWRTRTRLFSS